MHIATLSVLFLCALASSQAYNLVDDFSGANFFNGFQYFTGADPTHGYVNYVSASVAHSEGLTSVDNGIVHIRSSNKGVASGSGRDSVRLTSNKSYNKGLFLIDVQHMPYGCGNWPAIWTVGPNWPNSGEIDIIEGVNNQDHDSMTLHTGGGCTMTAGGETGTRSSTNCVSSGSDNTGCGVQDTRANSFGSAYNQNNGGVHAMEWTANGIKIWFFPRGKIPTDINNKNPAPAGWGEPVANFPFGSNCAANHFANHQIVIDNTFCGDWAGAVYASMGCPGSCVDHVQNNPGAFSEAFWAINSIRVYQ